MADKIRLLIVDDQHMSRHFIRDRVSEDPAIEIIGEADNGNDALELIQKNQPDAVLLDYRLEYANGLDGCELIKTIKHQNATIKIISVTSIIDPYILSLAFEMGADSIIFKDELSQNHTSITPPRVIDVIKKTIQGERCLPQLHELAGKITAATNERHAFDKHLNTSQQQVLALLAQGKNNTDIAKALNKTEGYIRTIKSQLGKIADNIDVVKSNDINTIIEYYKKLHPK